MVLCHVGRSIDPTSKLLRVPKASQAAQYKRPTVVRRSYRKLAMKWHPDKNKSNPVSPDAWNHRVELGCFEPCR